MPELPNVHTAFVLVFTAGGYRFFDFLRAGGLLLLFMWLTLSSLIVFRYGLA